MKRLEDFIYTRARANGELSYNVRIGDAKEPTALWYNQTFKNLDIARKVRDEKLAEKALEVIKASKIE
jgi:hypothetical protein